MYKTRDEALQFVYAVNMKVPNKTLVDTVVCAQATVLRDLVKRKGENLEIGAQNMHEDIEGAYTGEISAAMLENIGVSYVVVGHSERRQYFAETDEAVNKKALQALRYDITPIVCIGESLALREKGETESFVGAQLDAALSSMSKEQVQQIVIAYEPIWAIGTGKTATDEQADQTIGFIRERIEKLYDLETAQEVRILYGGSVKPENIDGLMAKPHIDGALVGGASLNAQSFLDIVDAAQPKK